MKKYKWQIVFVASLIALSASFYLVDFLVFHDLEHIINYLLIDLGLIPIEVLRVTVVIERLLNLQERKLVAKKMNMVSGAFYSQVGMRLLKYCITFFGVADELQDALVVKTEWVPKQFLKAVKKAEECKYHVDSRKAHLEELRDFLTQERGFLLRLLENPNVLEHEAFAELLWAVFHLTEELCARAQLKGLPEPDYEHLGNDIKRAYRRLVIGWLMHMQHLSKDYPYLFSLAVRTNPFDDNASVVIRQ